MLALVGEMGEQSAVGRVAGGPGYQLVDLCAEAVCLVGEGGLIQGAGVVGVAEGQRVQQNAAHRVRSAGLTSVGVVQQLSAAAQQVRQAALVVSVGEAAVGRPAVAFQHPGVVGAQDLGGVLVAAPTGKAGERFKVACGCQPPRSFWIRAKQYTPGPITCRVCGQDFHP